MTPFEPLMLDRPLPPMQELVNCLGWTLPIIGIVGAIQIWILVRCAFSGVDGIRMTLFFAGTLAHLVSTLLACTAADIRICQVLGQVGMTDPALLAVRRSEYLIGLYAGVFITFISAVVGVLFFAVLDLRRGRALSPSTNE